MLEKLLEVKVAVDLKLFLLHIEIRVVLRFEVLLELVSLSLL